MPTAYLSLGSNQAPEQHLPQALAELAARFGPLVVSPTYRTAAVGFAGDDFLNSAVILDSDLDVHALDAWLHALEDAHGRRRDQPRFSDRPLDLDIIFFDQLVLRGAGHLQVPRPELAQAFVLKPLADIAPDFVDPLSGLRLAELWARHPAYGMPMPVHHWSP